MKMYLRTYGSFNLTQIKKRLRPQIANPQSVTFAEDPKSIEFAEHICDPLARIVSC
jgi:hypothetical protein